MINYLEKVNTSVVMSNIDVTREAIWPKRKLFHDSRMIEINGEKLGICGYILKTTPR